MYVLYECDGMNVCNVYYQNKQKEWHHANKPLKETISCYSLVKHYRGEYMYMRWRIEPVYRAPSVKVGTGGRTVTNQQSHAALLLSTTEENTYRYLRWRIEPVYRAPSVRVGTEGRLVTN
jgi:hypothetical protein